LVAEIEGTLHRLEAASAVAGSIARRGAVYQNVAGAPDTAQTGNFEP